MESRTPHSPYKVLAVLRVVALAAFALSGPAIAPRLIGLAVLYVAAASALNGLRYAKRRYELAALAGTSIGDAAWLAAAFVHFGPLNSLPALAYAGVVAALTASASWGVGAIIGLLGALVYYTLSLIYRGAFEDDAQRQLLVYQTATIAIAGIISGYMSGQASRLARLRDLADRLERLNGATAEMIAARADGNVLQCAVEHAAAVLPAARAWVMRVDFQEGVLALDAHLGVSPPAGVLPAASAECGIAGAVARTGEPLSVKDSALTDPRLSALERALTQDHLVAAPIPDTNGVRGVILASRDGARAEFTDVDLAFLTMLGRSVGSTLQTTRLIRDLRETATADSLTGLHNHGAFLEELSERTRRARAEEQELSLIILDVDRFKRVNDLAGHWQGDRVLKALAEALRQQCRSTDVIGRCGGDEFAVLLPGTGPEESERIVQRAVTALREVGEEMRLPVPVTASWGVACFPWDAADYEALFRTADSRLYEAKRASADRLAFENIVA